MQLFHDFPAYSAAGIEAFHILFQPFLTDVVINFIPVGIGNHPYQRRQVTLFKKPGVIVYIQRPVTQGRQIQQGIVHFFFSRGACAQNFLNLPVGEALFP